MIRPDKCSMIDVSLSSCPTPAPQLRRTSGSHPGCKTRRNITQKWEPWELLILQASFKDGTHPSRTRLKEIGRKLIIIRREKKQKKEMLCDGDLEKENQRCVLLSTASCHNVINHSVPTVTIGGFGSGSRILARRCEERHRVWQGWISTRKPRRRLRVALKEESTW